ncbi:MAG TPA: hypothetical protein VN027_13185 [Isoptericola sp.]|nr:hypothetical protein [Isoptericola sp.]
MSKKLLALSSLAVAGALALGGCDGGPTTDAPTASTGAGQPENAAEESAPAQDVPPYSEIADDVKANVAALTSLTLTGTFVDDGEPMTIEGSGAVSDEGDFTLGMSGTVDGKPADATIVRVDGATYLKASPQFFAANFGDSDGAIADALGGKYLRLPKDAGVDDLSLESFVDMFAEDLPGADDVPDDAQGELVEFHGQQVYEYAAEDGTAMQVTSDGSNQLVGVSSPGDGEVVLSDLNEAPGVQAPDPDDVMDLSTLTGE